MAASNLPFGPDPMVGRKLGKYEILSRLSTGGMSEIFLAFQRGMGGFRKIVVLKQILPDIKGEEEFVRMFLDEARITGMFAHPNIAQVFDLDIAEGELFLAMEFVPGATLVEVARACRQASEPIPIGFTLMAVRDTALALHYAHTFTDPAGRALTVIHRDIAEKNIMVTYEGVTKLLDFGIAKNPDRSGHTSVGMVKGTSGYMSPEQITGQKLDARSDIFSLGVVLHECLTGMRLFPAKSGEDSLLSILREDSPPPSRQNRGVTPEVDAVTVRALARDRDVRYPTALEFARDIERVAAGLIWLPERAGAYVKRFFADRREQTRLLMEDMSGEHTAEVQLAELLAQYESPPPPLPPSPPKRPSSTDSQTDPRATIGQRPSVKMRRTSLHGASPAIGPEPKTVMELPPPLRHGPPPELEVDTVPGVRGPPPVSEVSETSELGLDPASTSETPELEEPRRRGAGGRAALSVGLGAVVAFAAIGGVLWVRGGVTLPWGTTSEGAAAPPAAPPAVEPATAPITRNPEHPSAPVEEVVHLAPVDKDSTPAPENLPAASAPATAVQTLAPHSPAPPVGKKSAVTRSPTHAAAEPEVRDRHRRGPTKPVAPAPPSPDEVWSEAERERKQTGPHAVATSAKPPGEPGQLNLFTDPPASVLFQAQELGGTPLNHRSLPAGTHTLRLVAQDGRAYRLIVDIKAGATTTLHVALSTLPPD